MSNTPSQTEQFLKALHRGGSWAYWWTFPGKASTWYKAGQPAELPNGKENVYFGVHPSTKKGGSAERSKLSTIEVLNCLFAEFDAKDFEGGIGEALTYISSLELLPSVLINSGGGYHAYWLLRTPILISDEAEQEKARELQAAWVQYVGGDPGAKDLARVLRVPGTKNYKYDPPRDVSFTWADFNLLHDPEVLESLIPVQEAAQKPQDQGKVRSFEDGGDYWLKQAILRAGVGRRNDTGLWLSCQLRDNGLSQAEAEIIMRSYANNVPQDPQDPYKEKEAIATLKSAYSRTAREPSRRIAPTYTDLGTAPDLSREPGTEQALPMPGMLTDAGNALRLARRHGDRLRWVHSWGWLVWHEGRWERDKRSLALSLAKDTARDIYREAAEADDDEQIKKIASWAGRSLNKPKLDAMLAVAHDELAMLPDDFDTDPMRLNALNGIVDLKTGALQAHDPGAYFTKITGAEYIPEAACPTWLDFLDRILDSDKEMIDFIQRAIGYSLTGDVSEQSLFFLYGTGANGKSTFIQAVLAMLGDYGKQAAPQLLMAGNRHPTEVADLQGSRFVATIEVEEGRKMAEVLVKQLTGGDRITARFMRFDFFEFEPSHKIWLAANHKPPIHGTDLAIWRRIRLIPFEVTIPEEEQDRHLIDKLKAEIPGILAWAVQGALEWQRIGLSIPTKVREATEEYKSEMDILAGFLDERCVFNKLASISSGKLYDEYKEWAMTNGEEVISHKKFSARMKERGYVTQGRDNYGRALYPGIGLRQVKNEEEEIPPL